MSVEPSHARLLFAGKIPGFALKSSMARLYKNETGALGARSAYLNL